MNFKSCLKVIGAVTTFLLIMETFVSKYYERYGVQSLINILRNNSDIIEQNRTLSFKHTDIQKQPEQNRTPTFKHTDIQKQPGRRVKTFNTIYLPSAVHSVLEVQSGSKVVSLGDYIYVNIRMYDSLGRALNRGGDLILLWMEGTAKGSAVAGRVTDHGNGSYTGVLRAMWSGETVIKCAIACSKEGFDLMYRYFEEVGQSRPVWCTFVNRQFKESTIGSPNVPIELGYCNLTRENYGNQWYCGKPRRPEIQCKHWTGYQARGGIFEIHLIHTPRTYIKRAIDHVRLQKYGHATITTGQKESLVPSGQCGNIPPRQSWSTENPIGFFYNTTWYLSHCQPLRRNIQRCFQDKNITLFGDSTTRQWFEYLVKLLDIQRPIQTNKHQTMHGIQKEHNYQLHWLPHGTPIYYDKQRHEEHRPVFDRLNDIPTNSRDVFLIHLNAHFQYHHPSAFRRSMRATAESVERLVKRAPGVKVAIKGPHYYTFRDATLGGMWGPLYDKITRDEFRNLFDSVHFVDDWYMTVAKDNDDIHPPADLVEAMVNVFLAYVCN